MEIVLLLGKILSGLIFIDSGISHFRFKDGNVAYARAKGLPLPELGVVASGLLLIIAPVLFVLGIAEIYALSALAVFLFLTSIIFHKYWKEQDSNSRGLEKMAFYKNLSMLGLVLVIISVM